MVSCSPPAGAQPLVCCSYSPVPCSVASVWQKQFTAAFPLLLSTKTPVLFLSGDSPVGALPPGRVFWYSTCMTERNVTMALAVLATFSSAVQEMLIAMHGWYGYYCFSRLYPHIYILIFSYFQNFKQLFN